MRTVFLGLLSGLLSGWAGKRLGLDDLTIVAIVAAETAWGLWLISIAETRFDLKSSKC